MGVEVDPKRIEDSRALFGDLPIRRTQGTKLDFAAEAFDLVTSFDVLEHIPSTDIHFAEVYRVLKPSGAY